MSKLWQNSLSKAEKIALSQRIAGATGMDERAVEKDWCLAHIRQDKFHPSASDHRKLEK